MSDDPHLQWAGARGRQWLEHLAPMEAMLAPLNRPLLRALAADEAGTRIVEIGCGGGATARFLAEHAPAGGTVHGVDISADLIEAAAARAQGLTLGNELRFAVRDAEHELPDVPYDRLCSRFGVMFFTHPPAAFSNLRRWLRPRGRFALAVWGPTEENPWMGAARAAVEGLVEVAPPPADAPGAFRYADADAFLALLRHAGFANLTVDTWRGDLAVGGGLDAEGAARFALSAFAVGEPVTASPALFATAVAHLSALYAAHEREGIVRMGACVHLVHGTA